MTNIHCGTGDHGKTGICNTRIAKNNKIIDLIGEIDELQAWTGICSSEYLNYSSLFIQIQKDLHDMMSFCSGHTKKWNPKKLVWLENHISNLNIKPPKQFLLFDCEINLVRTVCRRTERSAVHADQIEIIPYLNRLSTLFYLLALREKQSTSIF